MANSTAKLADRVVQDLVVETPSSPDCPDQTWIGGNKLIYPNGGAICIIFRPRVYRDIVYD